MSLAYVVEYLNDRLHQLHPHARLGQYAHFHYKNGVLTASVTGLRLRPYQVPVVRSRSGEVLGYSAQCLIESNHGQPIRPETLYIQALDADDVVFLDRFLRTLHALHHLDQNHDPQLWLVLDVHLRHVNAVPEQHGQVFEELLIQLGLTPRQIVLRLPARALQLDPHIQTAARNFVARGYRLLAARPELIDTPWETLHAIGVQWVAPDVGLLQTLQEKELLNTWGPPATNAPMGIWIDRITSPEGLARAWNLGAELVEGDLFHFRQRHCALG